jgi:hypothetical protein
MQKSSKPLLGSARVAMVSRSEAVPLEFSEDGHVASPDCVSGHVAWDEPVSYEKVGSMGQPEGDPKTQVRTASKAGAPRKTQIQNLRRLQAAVRGRSQTAFSPNDEGGSDGNQRTTSAR